MKFLKICLVAVVLFSFLPRLEAEELRFTTLGGRNVHYREIAASPKAVLFLWTTWCFACRKALTQSNQNCVKYPDIDFFYINLGDRTSAVRRLASRLGLTNCIMDNMLLDKNSSLVYKFSVFGVPTYILLKEGGVIYKTHYINEPFIRKAFRDE